MRSGAGHRRGGGFTLLEVVLAIGLLALLVGMIFSVASQNIALANLVVEKQNQSSGEAALFSFLGDQLNALPGNARMELASQDSGAQYLSDLTIEGVPLSFNWGGRELVAKSVRLSTLRRRDGFLDIVLRYYEHEILEETQDVGDTRPAGFDEPFAEVVLMEDVYLFEWRVLNGRTLEWSYDWDFPGQQPLQMELTFWSKPEAERLRQVFWITPKQNPEVVTRQQSLQRAPVQPGGPEGGGGSEEPADGDNEVVLPPIPGIGR